MFYFDSVGGESAFKGASALAEKMGGITITPFTAGNNPEAIFARAQALAKTNVQATVLIGPSVFMAQSIKQLRKAGSSRPVYALSYLVPDELVKVAGPDGANGVSIVQTYPNATGMNTPLQREFAAAMKTSFPDVKKYTNFHLEGYLCAKLFVEVAKKMASPSPAEFAKQLKAAGLIDLNGYRVDFSKSQAGSNFVDIALVKSDGNLRY